MDVKGLLAGKKVKLVKKKDDWTLTIENLISMAKTETWMRAVVTAVFHIFPG